MAVTVLAAAGLSAAAVSDTNHLASAPSPFAPTNAVPTRILAPTQVNLPPVAAEVLRMSEAGISDDVITAYIQNSANTYSLDADQIVYLRDVGVSSAVLNALTAHSQPASGGAATEAAGGPAGTQNGFSQAVPATTASSTPVSGPADSFYDTLAPYGTWLYVPAYGWCWQPTVVVVNPAWQPYCNDGCWLWTDNGWYWNSYYAWGWAPFHYGRWCQYPGYGWIWCPDRIWGPAWVCWRNYPGYCGWAPLPPGACFTAGIGWTFNGVAVGFNFGFGLGPRCFTFCDYNHFCGRHSFGYFYRGRSADRFFHNSAVDNNFAADAHHGFINRGIDPSRIEGATHTRIPQVAVRELPRGAGRGADLTMPDRLTRNGNSAMIYRPGPNIAVRQNPFLPGHDAQFASRQNGFTATRGFTGSRVVANAPQFQSGRPNGLSHPTPAPGWNYSHGAERMRQWGGVGNFQETRSQPAPNYRQNSYAWHSAPVWHAAPSYAGHSAPSWSGSHFSGSSSVGEARSWGGAQVGGGQSFGGGGMHFGGGGGWGGGVGSGGGFHR